MKQGMALWASAVGVVIAFLFPALALAAPAQATREDVLATLGIERSQADYVVVVDVSGSMLADDRYGRVRSALTGMMAALRPGDHVSMVTFSDTAELVYRGTDKQAALDALPASPTGLRTDIGAGIEAGLAELRREGANATGVLALITDGTLDTNDASRFATADAPGWADLRATADGIAAERQVAAYAIALADETDAGLLSQVFPSAENVPGDQIGQHLGAIDAALLDYQAAERLRPDAAGRVSASWSGVDPVALAERGTDDATLTLTSHLAAAPVEVTGLELSVAGDSLSTNLPDTVTLAPGESQEFPVALSAPAMPEQTDVTLQATLESPWADAMATWGVPFAATLDADPLTLPATPESAAPTPAAPLPGWLWPSVAGALALALLAWLVATRRPRMNGSMRVTREGAVVTEFLLEGTGVALARAAGPAVPGLAGRVSPGPKPKDGRRGVRVVGRVGSERFQAVLADGESVEVGDATLTYTAQRTRTLAMVGMDASAATPSTEPTSATREASPTDPPGH